MNPELEQHLAIIFGPTVSRFVKFGGPTQVGYVILRGPAQLGYVIFSCPAKLGYVISEFRHSSGVYFLVDHRHGVVMPAGRREVHNGERDVKHHPSSDNIPTAFHRQ